MKNFHFKIIVIIFFLIHTIKSEKDCSKCTPSDPTNDDELKCTGDECDPDCMWLRIDSENYKCLSCDGISNGESKYYSKGVNLEGNSYCHKIGISGFNNKKIIYKTNQIVEDCLKLGLYEMGDVCYHSNPDTTNIEVKDTSTKKLKCINYNYKKLIEDNNENKIGLKKYECLASDEICAPELNYFDDETKECFNSCPSNKPRITPIEETGGNIYYRCSSGCYEDYKFEFTKKSALDQTKIFCLEECPEEAKCYYDTNKKCIEYCNINDNDFSDSTYKCINDKSECSSKFFLVNSNRNYFHCENSEFSSCPNEYPFLYKNGDYKYCLITCEDTNIPFFGSIKTYFYLEEKECRDINNRPTVEAGNPKYYLDEIGKQWVSDCLDADSGPFHDEDEKKCVKNCGVKYLVEDTNECISTCDTNNYYIDEETKTCVRSCPSHLERGFYNSEKKCVKCGINRDGNVSGFHKKNDDDKECFSTCPSEYKYNYKSNILFENGCQNNGNAYSVLDKPICYSSCKDAGEDYKNEINFICYKDEEVSSVENINSYYFYKDSNRINKYITIESAFSICYNLGLKFIKGSECIKNCLETDYIIYPTSSSLGFCFSDYAECKDKTYIYYNNDKICRNSCTNGYTVKNSDGTLVESIPNCIDECPTNFPFENDNDKTCLENCPTKFYKEVGNRKICLENCDFVIREDENGNKICSESCITGLDNNNIPIFGYYYTKTETEDSQTVTYNICIDNCNTNESPNDKFAIEATNEPQKCIGSCPDSAPYYYNDANICLKKCNKYYNGNICVDTCNSFIYKENNCVESCPYDAPFYIETQENSLTIKKCVTSCVEKNYAYYDSNKKCIRQEEFQTSTKMIFNGEIIDSCPTNLIEDSNKKCVKPNEWTEEFFKIEEGVATELGSCETTDGSTNYITTSSECVSKCPLGENFIKDDDNHCLSSCSGETPYYKKIEDVKDASNTNIIYSIYKCLGESNVNDCYFIEEEKYCMDDCDHLYQENNNLKCKLDCDGFLIFNNDNKFICQNECGGDNSYYGNEQICDNQCSFLSTKIIDDSNESCVNKCTANNYLVLENNKLHCKDTCDNLYLPSEYKCVSKCPPYTYANEEKNECMSECPEPKKIKYEEDQYICLSQNSCPEGYYNYEESRFCITSCNPGDYVLIDTNICVKSCPSENEKKYFYEYDSTLTDTDENLQKDTCVSSCIQTNKPYTRLNNHCDVQCDSDPSGDYYYDDTDKKCKKQCDEKTNNRLCKSSCEPTDETNPKKNDDSNICVENCGSSIKGNIYNENGKFKCINQCPTNTFIYNNICYSSCSSDDIDAKYIYNEYCVPNCLKDKRYYVDEEKKCLDDCPPDSPYFTIIKATNDSPDLFTCQPACSAYIPNSDSTKNSMLCLGDDCSGAYPYFIEETKNGNRIKHCYSECPSDHFYEKVKQVDEKNIECVQDCSSITDSKYHFKNDNKCIPLSECKFLNFETKECLYSCQESKLIYETESLTYCLNRCSEDAEKTLIDKTLFLNYENKCVEDCKTNYEVKDSENMKCECENLFIIDKSRGIKSCLHKDEQTCEKQVDYPYLIYGTKECSDKCDGIISLDGTICYDSNYQCPENSSPITLSNDFRQCFCDYKYYYKTSLKKDLVCLPEDSKCIRNSDINRELLIAETKECVEFCPFEKYTKKYGKTCVQLCPIMSVLVNDECFCQDKWYMNDNDEMICCTECPEEKPIMIDETKECVSTCINTEYSVYYKNKCYKNCEGFEETELIENINSLDDSSEYKGYHLSEIYGKFGENICYCKGAWYEDGANEGCNDDNEKSCEVFDNIYSYKYTVLPTKQCVKECPEYFDYSFNEYCFSSCEEGNKQLKNLNDKYSNELLTVDNNGSHVCKCQKLWKYNTEEPSKLECIAGEVCPDNLLLIVATNECYNGTLCRQDYPLLFNNKCYNKDNCPENTIFSPDSPKTCSCVSYYYIDENSEIVCIGENEDCPEGYPNLIYSRDKCVKDGDQELEELFNFNGIYYNNCPLYTIYDEEQDQCVCNSLYGYWYKDESEGNAFHCKADGCPDEKPYLLISTWECLAKCNANGNKYVEYNGICYEECPELTKENENGVCELQEVVEAKNMTEFTKIITDNIASLYKISNKEDSDNSDSSDDEEESDSKIIDLIDSNLTVEFYGVNSKKKENKEKHNNKNKTSSSLSYIDLTECIQSIYESNNMRPEDDIIILKFDKKDTPVDYLINPVEYKFINSRNGQELDASMCSKGGIKISYPFSNIISNYDKLFNNKKRNLKNAMISLDNDNDLNTLTEKYNIGKEIYDEYSYIDTFNSKDSIYTDYCTAVEINGKDLILEDRMNYLLPHYSLCEKNCSYNHTDFEEERIYCDCSFKSEFDLNREHESLIDINENAVIQSQNRESNFPVLKCISVLSDSKRIKKNIGFYYMLIILIIEIVLLVMVILFGYKSFKSFFNNKICDNDITDQGIQVDKDFENNKNAYDEIIKTTQRLNAPPKKSSNGEEQIQENNNNDEVEFIPEEFVFLYFNDNDKGVRKKVEKNLLPFTVKEGTKILLQKMENVDYEGVKASGPFHEDQNVIEVEGGEEKVNINIESINESLFDNNENIAEKNKISNKNNNEKELVTISEEKIYKRENVKVFKINEFDEIEEEIDKEKEIKINLLNDMIIEQRLLTKDYDFVKDKNDSGLFVLVLTEILDKIYITKIILFIRKYDIMFLDLSIYVLYHVILLNIIAMLYDIKTIKKIWNNENYPGFGLHLGYGLLSLLISWVIYLIFMCLLTNKGKYNEILNIKNSKKKIKEKKIELINKKYDLLLSKMKIKLIIYYIIQFILTIFFFIYLITLCAVYPGTMKRIFSSYGVAILEVIIIKILYGLILGILRSVSLSGKKSGMYNIVKIFDKYLV